VGGGRLITGGHDNRIHIWDLATKKSTSSIAMGSLPRTISVAPNLDVLAIGGGEFPKGELRFYDITLETGLMLLDSINGYVDPVGAAVFIDKELSRLSRIWKNAPFGLA
jgi:WD40 repeat protein